jgi:hypothetical protein
MSAIGAGNSSPRCSRFLVVSRAELSGCSTFTDQRKDYRYYEILDDTLRGRFDHRYFAIVDSRGHARAIQPFFLVDQDILEGLGAERVRFSLRPGQGEKQSVRTNSCRDNRLNHL